MAGERLSTYTRCTSCGALMLWCVTLGGDRWALDPRPHPSGTVVVQHLPDGSVRGRVLTGKELPAQQEAYRRHDRSCPGVERPVEGPKCGACRGLLDDWLVEQGYTRHIGCLGAPAPARPLTVPVVPAQPVAPEAEQGQLFDLGGGAAC